MREDYNRPPHSSNEQLDIAERSVAGITAKMHERRRIELEWAQNCPDTPETVFSYNIFCLAADLQKDVESIELEHTLESLRAKGLAAYQLTSAHSPGSIHSSLKYLKSELFGVSPADVLTKKKSLSRQQPVDVYGHMLLSSRLPGGEENSSEQHTCNFLPVTAYREDEIRSLFKDAEYPSHINSLLRDLASTYKLANQQVARHFFEPESKHFPRIVELYQEIATSGDDLQADMFHTQILNIHTPEQGRYAYSKLRGLTISDDHPAIYDECLAVIEDAFEGLHGPEVYELLDIEQSPATELSSELYNEAHRVKQQLLKAVKIPQGSIKLTDGQYGMLELTRPEVYYHKNGTDSYASLVAEIETPTGGIIPLQVLFSGKDSYSWSFLSFDEEVPELFNHVMETARQALSRAVDQTALAPTARSAPSSPIKKEHITDEIYSLRKQHREEVRQLQDIQATPAQTAGEQDTASFEVILPQDVADSLSEERLTDTLLAIEKFKSGLLAAKPLPHFSNAKGGGDYYSIRGKHKVRTVLKREGDVLTVVNTDMRGSVYRVRG